MANCRFTCVRYDGIHQLVLVELLVSDVEGGTVALVARAHKDWLADGMNVHRLGRRLVKQLEQPVSKKK